MLNVGHAYLLLGSACQLPGTITGKEQYRDNSIYV